MRNAETSSEIVQTWLAKKAKKAQRDKLHDQRADGKKVRKVEGDGKETAAGCCGCELLYVVFGGTGS